jgi:uncharacterized protein (DUF1684 family)
MKKAELGSMFSALAPLMMFFLLACPLGLQGDSSEPVAESYEETIKGWRQRRVERLTSDNGYLTQVGLEWLQQGENRLGSLESSTIRIPGGPSDWGTIFVDGDEIKYRPAAGAGILVDGEEMAEATLLADNQGEPTLVSKGDMSFYVISRGSYALRIKNRNSEDRMGFTGITSYNIQPDWRMKARFTRAAEGQTIEIANVLGQSEPSPVLGTVEFERDGETFRLIGLGDEQSSSLWFLFADRTSGRETYGAGRFLYSDGLPENGLVVVDFNKAYNPPCAFNDYSTCPLPPQENRLKLAVTAGEKKYHD